MEDVKPFLRLQSATWLNSLKTKVEDAIMANVEYTSMSMGGKSFGRGREIKTSLLAKQLAEVLVERDLGGSDYVAPTRMTVARFA